MHSESTILMDAGEAVDAAERADELGRLLQNVIRPWWTLEPMAAVAAAPREAGATAGGAAPRLEDLLGEIVRPSWKVAAPDVGREWWTLPSMAATEAAAER